MYNEKGESRLFGFVNFHNHEDADKAVNALNGSTMADKPIWCGRAQKKSEREEELRSKFQKLKLQHMSKYQGTNLYIKNLEDEIDEERLQKEFSAFGKIHSSKIMSDSNGISRGFGFVSYNTPEEAQKAISEMNSRILQSCTKPLYVALHEPKEIRRQKLAQRYSVARNSASKSIQNPPQIYQGQPMYYTGASVPSPFVYPHQMLPPRTGAPWTGPQNTGNFNKMPMVFPQRGRGNKGRGNHYSRKPDSLGTGNPAGGNSSELTYNQLSQFNTEHQKLLIGEKLWPIVHNIQPILAGKITGMLLESGWDIEELFSLIADEERLKSKIDEAVLVLQNAQEVGSDI